MRLIAQLVEDDVVDVMVPFVTENISAQNNWRQREAAVMAFGAVLEVRRRCQSNDNGNAVKVPEWDGQLSGYR